MAEWRKCNPSNKDDTCLWCGKKLRRIMGRFIGKDYHKDLPTYSKSGDYGDGFFCGLRCAYQFAVAFAGFGRRLNPPTNPQ
jgi:hypothetical protein